MDRGEVLRPTMPRGGGGGGRHSVRVDQARGERGRRRVPDQSRRRPAAVPAAKAVIRRRKDQEHAPGVRPANDPSPPLTTIVGGPPVRARCRLKEGAFHGSDVDPGKVRGGVGPGA